MRKKVALMVVGLALTACAPAFGSAAVVGGEKVSLSTVQESVGQVINQRRLTGEANNNDVANGALAQDQLRFQIISLIFAKAAKKVGVSISPSEFSAFRSDIIKSVGGESGLTGPLTQNAIALKDFDLYLYDLLYQRKISEKLVPGASTDQNVVAARRDALNRLIQETFTETKVVVNPRFGTFDPTTTTFTFQDSTNGALAPQG